MSPSLVVHDTVSANRTRRRSSILTCPRHPDAAPIPPSLVNSPYLSAPNSAFRRRATLHRWPSQEEDEWLRDMVPIDRPLPPHDVDARSEASGCSTPSPTSSDSPFSFMLAVSPPAMVRPRSTGPDASTPAKHAPCGPGVVHA